MVAVANEDKRACMAVLRDPNTGQQRGAGWIDQHIIKDCMSCEGPVPVVEKYIDNFQHDFMGAVRFVHVENL
ncbi:hypothetical protein NQZ68_034542 [Dissostichus eleginoides]|nr:hypothetical protein NQZ68_034542 [Dissostichus eleginoides]